MWGPLGSFKMRWKWAKLEPRAEVDDDIWGLIIALKFIAMGSMFCLFIIIFYGRGLGYVSWLSRKNKS